MNLETTRGRKLSLRIDNLVFGGGGARCFWEAGFASVLREEVGLSPSAVSAVSGGSVVAASFIAHNLDLLRENMRSEFERIDRNVRWKAAVGSRSILPHCKAYHRAIENSFAHAAMDRIREGPYFWVQITRPPASWPHKLAIGVSSVVHEAERLARNTPHGRWCQNLGFRAEQVDARKLDSPAALAELLIASGCIPPFIPLQQWKKHPALDGSLLDNAPVERFTSAEAGGETSLVLVTLRYANLPRRKNRIYVSPSKDLPADKLDFADAGAIEKALKLGKADGERFLRQRLQEVVKGG